MAVSERVREVVEQQVRTAIRNDGLDPLAQPERFRALVEQCAVDAWITHGATSDEGDPAFVAREVMQVFAGYGALQEFFEDLSPGQIKKIIATSGFNEGQLLAFQALHEEFSKGRTPALSTPLVKELLSQLTTEQTLVATPNALAGF